MDLVSEAQQVIDRLTAGGVRAVLDVRDVNPPCVQIRPPTLTFRIGRGTASIEWEAWLIVADVGFSQNLAALGELLEATQNALDWRGTTARPGDVVLPDGALVPMLRLTWTGKTS